MKKSKLVILSAVALLGVIGGTAYSTFINNPINTVTAVAGPTANLTFTEACSGKGTDSATNEWTITSDAAESVYDGTKGVHYGTGNKEVSFIKATCASYSNKKIINIVVNCSTAKGDANDRKVSVTIGGKIFGSEQTISTSAAEYTFAGEASGEIVVKVSQKKTARALYLKSIVVTYEDAPAKTLTGISAALKTDYTENKWYVGDVVTTDYFDVTATYDDSSSQIVTTGITLEGSPLVAGDNTITLSFEGKTTTITLNALSVTAIGQLEVDSTKTWREGDILTSKDIIATLTLSDNSTGTATDGEKGLNITLGSENQKEVVLKAGSNDISVTATAGGSTKVVPLTITAAKNLDFVKVNSVDDLIIGSQVTFVGLKNGQYYAVGEEKSNNFGAVAIELTSGALPKTTTNSFTSFALGRADTNTGRFTFKTDSNKYLYAAGSGSKQNYLRTYNTLNDNGRWNISFDAEAVTIQATGENTNCDLRFNANNSPLFSCYAKGKMSPLSLYQKEMEQYTKEIWAENLLHKLSVVCGTTQNGTTYTDELKGSFEGTLKTKIFNGLIQEDKDALKTAVADESTTIGQALARYDYIVRKYGSVVDNYLGRNVTKDSAALNGMLLNNDDLFTVDGLMIALTVGLVVTAGIAVYFYRKKKHN